MQLTLITFPINLALVLLHQSPVYFILEADQQLLSDEKENIRLSTGSIMPGFPSGHNSPIHPNR